MSTIKELNTVKDRVMRLLIAHPELRNDDWKLICRYYNEYAGVKPFPYDKHLTSPETIRRARQKIQAEGSFLPTDPKVLARRRKRRIVMAQWTRT